MDGAQLGRPVKRLREERRWPRWRVEREADVPPGYVSKLEAGKIASPGLEHIAAAEEAERGQTLL